MPLDQAANFVREQVTESVDTSQTTISISTVGPFPDPSAGSNYNVVIWDSSEYDRADEDPKVEVVRVTSIDTSNDELTVTRAEEGTVAAEHPSGAAIHMSPTAKMFDDVESRLDTIYDESAGELVGGNIPSNDVGTAEIDESITPTWTGGHTFDTGLTSNGAINVNGNLQMGGNNIKDYLRMETTLLDNSEKIAISANTTGNSLDYEAWDSNDNWLRNLMSIDSSGGFTFYQDVSANAGIQLSDAMELQPISEPTAPTSGWRLYTDSADGSLKAKDSDGSVTTIAS